MSESETFATHDRPVWRDRANYILQADLADHGMEGRFEQLWARDLGAGRYELCCLPFFTYGYALGDVVGLKRSRGLFDSVVGSVVTRSARDLLRLAFTGVAEGHQDLHASLVASGRPHEWLGARLVAVDIEGDVPDVIWEAVKALASSGELLWEWGRQPIVK